MFGQALDVDTRQLVSLLRREKFKPKEIAKLLRQEGILVPSRRGIASRRTQARNCE